MADVDVEDLWLDALDAQEQGNRDEMCEISDEIIAADPHHAEAWWMRAQLELPDDGQPTLVQASRCLRACKKSVEYDPENRAAWWRGGQILVVELGLLEEALGWWQRRREVAPGDTEPIIEQVAILADMGEYHTAAERLNQLWAEGMEAMLHAQLRRAAYLHSVVSKAAKREKDKIFHPWEPKHPGWKDIEYQRNRKPANEQYTFLMLAGPLVFGEVLLWNALEFSNPWLGMAAGFMLVLATVLVGIRMAKSLTQMMNRPAYNVNRAIDIEMTSGKVCFPEAWRSGKLYRKLLDFRSPAYRERLQHIIDDGEKLPRRWRPRIPDMTTVDIILEEE